MLDLDRPLHVPRSQAELDGRRAARRAQIRRRRSATAGAALMLAGLAVLPVMAAAAGTGATFPAQAAAPLYAGTVAATPTSADGFSASELAPCPIPASVRLALVRAAAGAQVELALVVAVADTESRFDPSAESGAGAQGLMQLEPATALSLGVHDPYDPYESAAAGARYLRQLLDRFGGSLPLALAGYNAGPSAVEQAGGVPDYPETIAYVSKVSSVYQTIRPCR